MKIKLAALTLAAAVCVTAVIATSCGETDVGVPCKLALPPQLEQTSTIINSQAMDCRSRVCMLFKSKITADAHCTATCDDDSDCEDANSGDQAPCKRGFICRIAQTVTGSLSCCKLCLCKDKHSPDFDAIANAACQGKPAVCPP